MSSHVGVKHPVIHSGLRHYSYTLVSLARSELRSCVKVEVAVLGSPSLIILVSVDVKQH